MAQNSLTSHCQLFFFFLKSQIFLQLKIDSIVTTLVKKAVEKMLGCVVLQSSGRLVKMATHPMETEPRTVRYTRTISLIACTHQARDQRLMNAPVPPIIINHRVSAR